MPLQKALGQVLSDTWGVLVLLGSLGSPSLHSEVQPLPAANPFHAPHYPRPKAGDPPSCVTPDNVMLLACHVMQGLVHLCDGGGAGARGSSRHLAESGGAPMPHLRLSTYRHSPALLGFISFKTSL